MKTPRIAFADISSDAHQFVEVVGRLTGKDWKLIVTVVVCVVVNGVCYYLRL